MVDVGKSKANAKCGMGARPSRTDADANKSTSRDILT